MRGLSSGQGGESSDGCIGGRDHSGLAAGEQMIHAHKSHQELHAHLLAWKSLPAPVSVMSNCSVQYRRTVSDPPSLF